MSESNAKPFKAHTQAFVSLLPGAAKRSQSVTADWQYSGSLIDGVTIKEVRNVVKAEGCLVEIFRRDWMPHAGDVDQVFQLLLPPGAISAWHVHTVTTDRLFASRGTVKIVLYDNRPDSPTRSQINEFRFGAARPALVGVPPGVWHGVQNIGRDDAVLVNVTDKAYDYADPDHWSVPSDTDDIPYRF